MENTSSEFSVCHLPLSVPYSSIKWNDRGCCMGILKGLSENIAKILLQCLEDSRFLIGAILILCHIMSGLKRLKAIQCVPYFI
jgi:hypothetical protein